MKKKASREEALEALAVIALFLWILHFVFDIPSLNYVSPVILALALFLKRPAAFFAGLWLRFAELLGSLNNLVLLSIIYYIVLTPVACLYRLFHRNPLGIKREETGSESFFYVRDHVYTQQDLERPF